MPDPAHFQVFQAEEIPTSAFGEISVKWIIDRSSAGSENILMGMADYPPGTRIAEHYHPNAEEVVFVLTGRGTHLIEGRPFGLVPGSFVFIPRGAIHALEASADESLEIIWAYGGAASLDEAGFVEASPQPLA